MSGFKVLIRKEWRENTRNFKVLWIPLVFIIFGMLEPISNHFLPEIMRSVGNMPEEAEFLWPKFTGEEIFMSLIGQYQFIGVLVIVLAFMGIVSGERKSGTATLLYVRPIAYRDYFLSKWLVANGIVLGSVWLGFIAAWYYIEILFNRVEPMKVLQFVAAYSLWIIFVVTVVLAFSAAFSTASAAGLSIFFVLIIQIVDAIIGEYWTVSPWKVPIYASYAFQENANLSNLWWSSCVTMVLIISLIIFGVYMTKLNAARTNV